jgi:hypothetical protein
MISDALGKQLHDRATCGEELSTHERAQLAAWYADQDNAESAILTSATHTVSDPDLYEQVAAIIRQLTVVTQTIQTLAQENAALRREIAILRHQVALQPA